MKRPLATLGIVFFLSLIAAMLMGLNLSMTAAAVFLTVFLFLLICRRMPGGREAARTSLPAALLSAVAAFSLFCCFEVFVYRPVLPLAEGRALVRMQVTELPRELGGDTVRCEARVLEDTPVQVEGQGVPYLMMPKGTRLLFTFSSETVPDAYDILEAEVGLYQPWETWWDEQQCKADGIYLGAGTYSYGGEVKIRKPDSVPLYYHFIQLRKKALDTVMERLPGDPGALVCSISYGYKGDLSDQRKENFRVAGIYHLLAVSGLHVGLVAQAFWGLLLMLKVNRRLAAVLAAGAVVFFMALTGFSPSVMRAGIMCVVYFGGLALRREADSLNSLGFALLVMTVASPFAAGDVGLLLSAGSTGGLLLILPVFNKLLVEPVRRREGWRRMLAKPVSALCVTFAATLPTLPILAVVMRRISLAAPLCNLLAVFPASVMMAMGCLVLPLSFSPFAGPLIRGLLFLAGIIARYLTGLVNLVASWEFAAVSVNELYVVMWILAGLPVLYAGWRLSKKKGLRLGVCACVLALTGGLLVNQTMMRGVTSLTVLDVGDGSALLLQRGGRAGLILAEGGRRTPLLAARALRQRGVGRLDFLLCPDVESNAVSGIGYLTRQIPIDTVAQGEMGYYSGTLEHIPAEQELLTVDGGAFIFWDDGKAVLRDGFVQIRVGDTSLLLCPSVSNAAALTERERCANLLIFTQTPPLHAAAFTAQAGVLSCNKETIPAVTKAVPWGIYPIKITGNDGDVTLYTRGRGDVEFQRYALPEGW